MGSGQEIRTPADFANMGEHKDSGRDDGSVPPSILLRGAACGYAESTLASIVHAARIMVSPRPLFLPLVLLLVLLAALWPRTIAAAPSHGVRPRSVSTHHTLRHALHRRESAHTRAGIGHAAAYAPVRTAQGVNYPLHLSTRHAHTAAALRRARRHGTPALQAAARQARMDAAKNQPLAAAPRETATLELPQTPVTAMDLPPMRGSHESLVRQNQRADEEGLTRVRDDIDIAALRLSGMLVSLPAGPGLRADPRLPVNRRYCRPWTASFLTDLARAHAQRFRDALQVNSAVRTIEYQRHLLRVNGNAAAVDGDAASPHLTGATIDIGKKNMTAEEVAWMRAYLSPLEAAGKIDVEEEFYQSCFHISVYRSYSEAEPAHALAAQPKQPGPPAPARPR
jgi:hypothetical protein